MRKINIGIIGCGIAANELHLPALKKLKHLFNIVACCNRSIPKAIKFSRQAGNIPYYTDYREMLEKTDMDAVDISLPIYLNYPVTKDCVKAGKHVIVEKPIAGNIEDAKKMLKLQNKYKNMVLMVLENFRYRQTYIKTKEIIDSGMLGTPYAVICNVFHYMTERNKYAKTIWRIKHKHIGGFISDGGVHFVSVLRKLFGEIKVISSFKGSINKNIGKIDTFSMQFSTSKKVKGILNLFYSVNGIEGENKFMIFCKNGSIVIYENKIYIKKTGKKDIILDIEDDGGHTSGFHNFYNAIVYGEKVISSFKEAYLDLKTIIDALKVSK